MGLYVPLLEFNLQPKCTQVPPVNRLSVMATRWPPAAAIFTIEVQKRRPSICIGYQNQLIREIRARMPLLFYSTENLINEFHA